MNAKTCDICQAPIPPHAPGGLCPACVLRGAEEPPPLGRAVPPPEEIAAAFPKLEILGTIGQGGMGFVYKARQPDLDRVVALKILAPELGRDPAFAERFAREARTLAKLHHPNIVTVFEHGESGGFFYLLMEYVDGVNLRQAMHAGRFTPEQALAIVPGICDALQAAHAQGIWHRDIKPENILLDREGRVKIADFGIARIVGDPQRDFTLTLTGNALGSAAYMAPEQHEKPHDVDHRADIYSLGVVIYEMLTGELPLGRFPLPSQRAEVNVRIDEIVLRALEKERELRQQSAEEVKTEVAGVDTRAAPNAVTSDSGKAIGNIYGHLSFGLLLASILGTFVLLALVAPGSHGFALLFGAASMLLSFGLALANWRQRISQVVLLVVALLLVAAGAFAFIAQLRERNALLEAHAQRTEARKELLAAEAEVKGKNPDARNRPMAAATQGGDHFAFTVHLSEKPIITVITDSLVRLGVGNSPDSQFNWSALRIDEDRASLAGNTYDLAEGAVFHHLSDGTFRQIEAWPESVLSGEKLEKLAENLKPAEAMLKLLEAARNGNGRLFREGLSRSFVELLEKRGLEPNNVGDFDGVRFIRADIVDSETAEVVVESNADPGRRFTFQMILEDGSWRLTEHGL